MLTHVFVLEWPWGGVESSAGPWDPPDRCQVRRPSGREPKRMRRIILKVPARLLSRSSLPGSSVPGILRAGIMEGVARPFSTQQSIGIYVIPILQMKRLRLSVDASFGHGCGPGGAAVQPVWARWAVLGTAPCVLARPRLRL